MLLRNTCWRSTSRDNSQKNSPKPIIHSPIKPHKPTQAMLRSSASINCLTMLPFFTSERAKIASTVSRLIIHTTRVAPNFPLSWCSRINTSAIWKIHLLSICRDMGFHMISSPCPPSPLITPFSRISSNRTCRRMKSSWSLSSNHYDNSTSASVCTCWQRTFLDYTWGWMNYMPTFSIDKMFMFTNHLLILCSCLLILSTLLFSSSSSSLAWYWSLPLPLVSS